MFDMHISFILANILIDIAWKYRLTLFYESIMRLEELEKLWMQLTQHGVQTPFFISMQFMS